MLSKGGWFVVRVYDIATFCRLFNAVCVSERDMFCRLHFKQSSSFVCTLLKFQVFLSNTNNSILS